MTPGASPMSGGTAPMENNPMEKNRSTFNPTDAAMMASRAGGEPTIEQWITQVLKVPGGVKAPMSQFVKTIQLHSQNKTMGGKAQNMGPGMQPPGGMRPPGMPPGGPMGAPKPPMPGGGMPPRRPPMPPGPQGAPSSAGGIGALVQGMKGGTR